LLVRSFTGTRVDAAFLFADAVVYQLIGLPMPLLQVLERSRPLPDTPESQRRIPSRLELNFTLDTDCTRMSVPVQEPPWRVIRAFPNPQRQAVVHLHNVSGGILSGDSLDLAIEARTQTRVQVTSVGATRIYRRRDGGETARLSTAIRVGEGATLEYLPDVIIPFSGSRFSQSTTVSLGLNAGFIWWESVAAGRIASGEEFAFDCLRSEASVLFGTRPIALERYSLTPSAGDQRSVARWGRFRYSATLYICHTGIPQPRWLDLESRLNDYAFGKTSRTSRWGVSALVAAGLVIRGLALDAHQITSGLYTFWDLAKRDIWGEPAAPPRKIN
jgi:urease accessory protein